MSTHDYDDARDGNEVKRLKESRLNASIVMLRIVEQAPENRRYRHEIRRAIRDDMAELESISGELWTKPQARSAVVREFERENHYEIMENRTGATGARL